MNKTSAYDLTIVVPIYNEEEGIGALMSALTDFLPHALCSACVLFINDGSTDKSEQLLETHCAGHPHFFFLNFVDNCGLSAAIKAGIDVAQSKYVGYIDADLQTTPEDFNLLIPHLESYKLVTGIRAHRQDTPFKRFQSKIANGFRRMMTNDGATDTGCPLKVLHTDYAKRIPFFTGMHRFLPALILLQRNGTYKELPVRHFPRVAGVSKYHLWNRLVGPFKDCFAYRWMKHRYINYTIESQNILEE